MGRQDIQVEHHFLFFSSLIVKGAKFKSTVYSEVCMLGYQNLQHQTFQIHCLNSESTQLHVRRHKLVYGND